MRMMMLRREMDEDEIGVPDNDELLALNYEAFRKMNAYAHEVFLCDNPQGKITVTWEQAHKAQQIVQPIHPMLIALYESLIRSSAGKIGARNQCDGTGMSFSLYDFSSQRVQLEFLQTQIACIFNESSAGIYSW